MKCKEKKQWVVPTMLIMELDSCIATDLFTRGESDGYSDSYGGGDNSRG